MPSHLAPYGYVAADSIPLQDIFDARKGTISNEDGTKYFNDFFKIFVQYTGSNERTKLWNGINLEKTKHLTENFNKLNSLIDWENQKKFRLFIEKNQTLINQEFKKLSPIKQLELKGIQNSILREIGPYICFTPGSLRGLPAYLYITMCFYGENKESYARMLFSMIEFIHEAKLNLDNY
jgi:hypothetical protein